MRTSIDEVMEMVEKCIGHYSQEVKSRVWGEIKALMAGGHKLEDLAILCKGIDSPVYAGLREPPKLAAIVVDSSVPVTDEVVSKKETVRLPCRPRGRPPRPRAEETAEVPA
jgi:hypothetical protein